MPKINLLSKDVSELIAAGEVIDRPCSVVKELLENSIDSGAKAITIEIKNGGITFIRISDNGCGISEEDISTAFLRHATSKIHTKDDLEKILTLGFRGEALASIAAISKVDVLTKLNGEQFGTHFRIEGAEEKIKERCGCPDGTTIVIRDIFYNVPARLKFLKKDVSEARAISSIIDKIALSHPEISFKLIRDNKQERFTPGDSQLYSAVYAVYGRDFAKSQIPVEYEYNGIKVSGYTVKPIFASPKRTFQNFFVNGRYVKSMTCMVSLEEAYRNLIMTGKFPSCVINITIPPEIVDVNVHPTKTEVRFSDEKLIYDSMYFAVKNAILADGKMNEEEIPAETEIKTKIDYSIPQIKTFEPAEQISFHSEVKKTFNECPKDNDIETIISDDKNDVEFFSEPVKTDFKYINSKSFEKQKEVIQPHDVVPEKIDFRVIGEVMKTYIIVECKNEMIIIDKHAAHERILFEKLKEKNSEYHSQMIVPEKILLSAEQYSALNDNYIDVMALGFTMEFCDNFNVIVSGIPNILSDYSAEELISEAADNIILNMNNPQSHRIDELYHTMACKAAIKAHDTSDIKELEKLTSDVLNNQKIRYCPHGRPITVVMTKNDLEKQFKRVL